METTPDTHPAATECALETFCPKCGGRFPGGVTQCEEDGASLLPVGTGNDRSGTVVRDKYVLLQLLGRGSFGSVYRAMHRLARTEFALKILHEGMEDDLKVRRQFLKEAQAVMRLHSPHTVQVNDVDEDADGRLFIVMELLSGQTLEQHLKAPDGRPRRLDPSEVIHLAGQIALALDEAHGNGVIHRDLKPANVMVCTGRDGHPVAKVVDFGIARLARTPDTETMATETMPRVLGTPAYMSPEQCRGVAVDGRSDLYGLGLMMYEMLGGTRPFRSETAQGFLIAHATEPPPPLSVQAPDLVLDPRLNTLVVSLLEKDPDRRPATARDLADRLREIATTRAPAATAHPPAKASPAAAAVPSATTPAARKGSSAGLFAVLAVLVIAALAAAGWMLLRPGDPAEAPVATPEPAAAPATPAATPTATPAVPTAPDAVPTVAAPTVAAPTVAAPTTPTPAAPAPAAKSPAPAPTAKGPAPATKTDAPPAAKTDAPAPEPPRTTGVTFRLPAGVKVEGAAPVILTTGGKPPTRIDGVPPPVPADRTAPDAPTPKPAPLKDVVRDKAKSAFDDLDED